MASVKITPISFLILVICILTLFKNVSVLLEISFTNMYFLFFCFKTFFIYFWERASACAHAWEGQREREREGETQNLKTGSRLSCQHRARHGARTHEPWDHDPSQSQMLHRLSHPGTPLISIFWRTNFVFDGCFSIFLFLSASLISALIFIISFFVLAFILLFFF